MYVFQILFYFSWFCYHWINCSPPPSLFIVNIIVHRHYWISFLHRVFFIWPPTFFCELSISLCSLTVIVSSEHFCLPAVTAFFEHFCAFRKMLCSLSTFVFRKPLCSVSNEHFTFQQPPCSQAVLLSDSFYDLWSFLISLTYIIHMFQLEWSVKRII